MSSNDKSATVSEIVPPTVTDHAVRILNEFFKLDPIAAEKLFTRREKTTVEVSKHESILCSGTDENPVIGFIGLLNGILSAAGQPRVASKHNERDRLIGFTTYTE